MRVENRLESPPDARSVLVIRLGALGDVVRTRFALPGLRQLYPRARLDWLVEDRAKAGLEGAVGIDEVVSAPRTRVSLRRPGEAASSLRDLARALRERRYDLVVDFHGILKSALLARATGAPVLAGFASPFAREAADRLYTHRARVTPAHLSRFDRNAALVEFLGGRVPGVLPPLALPETEAIEQAAAPSGLLMIHPGTSEATRYKRWAPERYGEVARSLSAQTGMRSLVTWGSVPGEREAAGAVVAASDGAARLAPATRGVADLLGLLRRGRMFLGSDSGPMHLASLAGLPVVALFGPTDPLENEPWPGGPRRTVRVDVGCSPCREGCPPRSCMDAIEVEQVLKAIRDLVAGPSGVH